LKEGYNSGPSWYLIPIVIITILGFIFSNIFPNLLHPQILLYYKFDGIHNSTLIVTNNGYAPATDLMLTVQPPEKLINKNIFSTENYTVVNDNEILQLHFPRLVQGNGSIVIIDMFIDPKINISNPNYISYVTHERGSVKIDADINNINQDNIKQEISISNIILFMIAIIIIGIPVYQFVNIGLFYYKRKNKKTAIGIFALASSLVIILIFVFLLSLFYS
jgi:hypothetical protein